VPVPWNEDPTGHEQRISQNAGSVLRSIVLASDQRISPTVAIAQDWHRRLYDGIPLPVPYYAGEVRDSDDRFPELVGYEVSVGLLPGVDSTAVWPELNKFERQAQIAVSRIDAAVGVGAKPASQTETFGVVALCTSMHGEWVRIHPFANGNGRTARLWANWAAVRYGLPPFVTIKPRPGTDAYRQAAVASMRGNDTVAVAVFNAMLRGALTG
jgi:fido (protein-threonine AMPylation protein)